MGVYEDELEDIFSDGEVVRDQSSNAKRFNCDGIFLRYSILLTLPIFFIFILKLHLFLIDDYLYVVFSTYVFLREI